jgi:hypothetical protein
VDRCGARVNDLAGRNRQDSWIGICRCQAGVGGSSLGPILLSPSTGGLAAWQWRSIRPTQTPARSR